MADAPKIVGALGLGGRVYRKNMEKELAAAAKAANLDLTPHIGEGLALSGDWSGGGTSAKTIEPASITASTIEGVTFASEAARDAAVSAGLTAADFTGAQATGKEGFTKPDVTAIVTAKEAK
jgi:hypothetical protein